jgi:hypothetical protein
MGDEFTEQDLDTPTEADLDSAYGSKFLSATDVGTRKIKTKILKVRKEELRGKDDKKRMRFVLFLESLDKPMVLNATNKDALVSALGKTPAKWVNTAVGLYVDPSVTFGGNRTGGLRLRVLGPMVTAKPAPQPTTKPPPAAAERLEEKGDPGFDPDLINSERDFEPVT